MTNAELIIKTKIWQKESIELIDYLNFDTIDNRFQINKSGVIRRNNHEVTFNPGENLPKTEKDLIQINKNNITGKYSINCGTWSKNLEKLVDETGIFMLYKGSMDQDLNGIKGNHCYKLSQGDIIKLGRIYLKVLDICLKKDETEKNSKRNNNNIRAKYKGTMIHSSSSSCLFINGQQIVKGAFSPSWINNNMKHSQIYFNKNDLNFSNSILTSRKKRQKNEQDSFNFDLFAKKKLTFLPKINSNNSNNDLFILKKFTKKSKKIKVPIDIFLKKPSNNNIPKTRPACRICYGENYNDENPLICPCICKGSMKYIHYICLRNWLNSKIEEEMSEEETDKENIECVTYNREGICCELCKTKFPDYIIHNNIYYNILFYKPKFKEYIIFESMRVNREKTKNYHVVTFDNREFINIGRANECELSLTELSVSRFHCVIHKENGQAFLEDNNSKFGTLVLVQNKNIIINEQIPLRLQVNKTYIKFKIQMPFSFWFSCCGCQDTVEKNKYEYHIQNKKGFDIWSYFTVKDDSNVWGIDDDNEEEEKKSIKSNGMKNNEINKDINKDNNIDNNININNNGLTLNIVNDSNIRNDNNLIDEEKKDKISLIDKSNINEKSNNEDIVEIESEIKNELISNQLNKINNKEEQKININDKNYNKNILNKNKNEISIIPKKNNNTTRIKKISIKRGKSDMKDFSDINEIKSENDKFNYNYEKAIDKNKNKGKNNINSQNNPKKNVANFDQTNSRINIKKNLNIFNPELIDDCSEIIKHNFTEKKDK